MGTYQANRIWLAGGVLAAVLLVVAGWFLLIHPKYNDAAAVRGQTDGANLTLVALNKQVAALNEQKKDLPNLNAKLEAYQQALPSGVTDTTAFLRQLQDSGNAVNVDVSGISVGAPTESKLTGTWEQLISLTADGSPSALSRFLDGLQSGHGRALLITAVALAGAEGSAGKHGMTANLSMKAFFVPADASTATITTK